MGEQMVWVDAARCTGCGACVEACPVGAIALEDGKARVDEETCAGCEACVSICLEDAIQPMVRGELVPVPERPAPAVRQPSPLAASAGMAVAVTGARLLAKAAGAVGRWLTRPSTRTDPSAAEVPSATEGRDTAGQGRRARHRRRGQ